MKRGDSRDLCSRPILLLQNHMKALVYAKIFDSYKTEKQKRIPVEAVRFSQAILKRVVQSKQILETYRALAFVIWTLVGRTLLTYLFQLVGE